MQLNCDVSPDGKGSTGLNALKLLSSRLTGHIPWRPRTIARKDEVGRFFPFRDVTDWTSRARRKSVISFA
jgi:hypothetical protein